MSHNEPTIASILRSLATQYDGPVSERHVMDRVLEQRPSTAKNPYATIRERLRSDGSRLGWVRLDRDELAPLHAVLKDLRFRCVPTANDVLSGTLPLTRLQPFAGLRDLAPLLYDESGIQFAALRPSGASQYNRQLSALATPSFDLREWYDQHRFAPGDSILVTITDANPLTFQIFYENAARFHSADMAAQDAELIDKIYEQVARSHTLFLSCEDVVLLVFARAAWRTAYPGTAWQTLVEREPRLNLIDGIFITKAQPSFLDAGAYNDWVYATQAIDEQLFSEIDQLQDELRVSRQHDAEQGVWDGQFQSRTSISNSRSLFDRSRFDPSPGIEPLLHFDADHLDALNSDEDDLDGDDLDWGGDDLNDNDDDLFDEASDVKSAEGYSMDFVEAQERLLAILPLDAVRRLQDASSEEAELIIASYLNYLLVRDPSLFVHLDFSAENSALDNAVNDTLVYQSLDTLWIGESDKWKDNDEWDEVWEDDWEITFEADTDHSRNAYVSSSELINQFYNYLIAIGRSLSTARTRTNDLWAYAEFLASSYHRTMIEGDYATLDEFLFSTYPRRTMSLSSRQIRELCTSLKQFYRFLKERGDISDDRFAEAIWRRRDQAAHVFSLYQRIPVDSPDAEKLIARLFAPYEALS